MHLSSLRSNTESTQNFDRKLQAWDGCEYYTHEQHPKTFCVYKQTSVHLKVEQLYAEISVILTDILDKSYSQNGVQG